MASSNEYFTYVLELLREVPNVTYRKMMGEYIFYKDGVIFGGLYDNRFLVKITQSIKDYGLREGLPYQGGSMMYLIDSEDPDEILEIVNKIVRDLRGEKK